MSSHIVLCNKSIMRILLISLRSVTFLCSIKIERDSTLYSTQSNLVYQFYSLGTWSKSSLFTRNPRIKSNLEHFLIFNFILSKRTIRKIRIFNVTSCDISCLKFQTTNFDRLFKVSTNQLYSCEN